MWKRLAFVCLTLTIMPQGFAAIVNSSSSAKKQVVKEKSEKERPAASKGKAQGAAKAPGAATPTATFTRRRSIAEAPLPQEDTVSSTPTEKQLEALHQRLTALEARVKEDATPSSPTEKQMQAFDQRLIALETKVKNEKIYNSPARATVTRAYNLFLTGDFLYLQPEEGGLEFAIKTDDPTFTLPVEKLRYKNLDFDYNIGWRAGVGFNVAHGSWDLYGNWMYYNTDTSGHSHAKPGEGIVPVWSGFDPFAVQVPFIVTDAHAKWRLHLNIIDAELGRDYDVGRRMTLRPSMAIRTGFIDQYYHVIYSPIVLSAQTGTDKIKLKNQFWGVGPKAGIDAKWMLGRGFGIYGSAGVSLLFGEFAVRRNETFENLPLPNLKVHNDFHQVRAITDLSMGILFDFFRVNHQYHFGLRAGYEQHLYFGQNQLDRIIFNSSDTKMISNLGDLSLQGWSGSLRVDF